MLAVVSFFWFDQARANQRTARPWRDPKTGETHMLTINPDEVRIWDRMVARHLTIPHRRVCVTHRPDWIDFMETVPLDMTKHVPGTCLVKLMAHRPDMGEVLKADRILLMDIDCVVTGSLDPIVDRSEPAVWWKNPNFATGGRRGFVQGSMQLFSPGATSFLWEDFGPTAEARTAEWFDGKEQAWISTRLNAGYPGMSWEWNIPHWTEADGVYGRGRLFNGKMGAGVTTELPGNARIVFTPGNRSPSQPEFMKENPWAERFYHA